MLKCATTAATTTIAATATTTTGASATTLSPLQAVQLLLELVLQLQQQQGLG